MAADAASPGRRRTALVTGASRGLGAALARTAPEDLDLVLTARSAESLAETAAQAARPGREVRIIEADLASAASRADLIAETDGRIDILVNNAAVGSYGAFLDADPYEIARTVEVNAAAPVELTRRLLPGMLRRADLGDDRAGLINLSSGFAFVPVPSLAVYGATKAMILSLTEALAAELSDRPIDVLAVCPGPVRTGFGERAGWGGSMPGAMSPDFVARQTWRALGRQRTLVLGPLDTPLFGPAAFARGLAAQAAWRAVSVMERVRGLRR